MNPQQWQAHQLRPPQPAPPQPAPPPRQPPPPPPPQHIAIEPTQLPFNPMPFRELLGAMQVLLDRSEARTNSRLHAIEIAIGGLNKRVEDAFESAKATREVTMETKDGLELVRKIFHEGTDSVRALIGQVLHTTAAKSERIEHILGDPDALDSDEKASNVLGRIARVECAMMELSESVSDPDAARATIVRHEVAVNTSPLVRPTADVGVDAVDLLPPIQLVDHGVQADVPATRDAQVEARPNSPARVEMGSQTVRAPTPTHSTGENP